MCNGGVSSSSSDHIYATMQPVKEEGAWCHDWWCLIATESQGAHTKDFSSGLSEITRTAHNADKMATVTRYLRRTASEDTIQDAMFAQDNHTTLNSHVLPCQPTKWVWQTTPVLLILRSWAKDVRRGVSIRLSGCMMDNNHCTNRQPCSFGCILWNGFARRRHVIRLQQWLFRLLWTWTWMA